MPRTRQILDALNQGIVVLDPSLRVETWSRWMAIHSGISEERIAGRPLFEFYPNLDNPVFNRNCRSVLAFGNFAFFSQKLHRFLFPMPGPAPGERMQQSCVLGPIRGEDGRVEALFLTVQDVTDLVQHEQRLVQMNIRDGLTGVFNRRYLDHRLEVEFERFRRYGRRLAVVLVDIDHFKRVNDELGHPAGDAVLVHLAGVLVEAVRRSDVVARYGGEEFCCVLPETDLAGAATVAEKLRSSVQAMRHCWQGQELRLTVSLGVSESRDCMAGPEALVARADAALYAAKEGGRNRVALDAPSPGSQAQAS